MMYREVLDSVTFTEVDGIFFFGKKDIFLIFIKKKKTSKISP